MMIGINVYSVMIKIELTGIIKRISDYHNFCWELKPGMEYSCYGKR